MYLSKMSYSRSPYGDTFDIVDKTSVYEDGAISCMCKVRYLLGYKYNSLCVVD